MVLASVVGGLDVLKDEVDEGVVSTAAYLLLPMCILISSPLNRAANTKQVSLLLSYGAKPRLGCLVSLHVDIKAWGLTFVHADPSDLHDVSDPPLPA
jgi:hypothetical protein